MSLQHLQETFKSRRSVYDLNDSLPVSKDEITAAVEHAILHTPSAFNSQSTRLVVLFGEEHQKLWDITKNILREMVPSDSFADTEKKLNGFRAGAGTVMFFEDEEPVNALQEKFPAYSQNFPVWSEHTNAMHQYAIWTSLRAMGLGANLQHYNPVIDQKVAETWNIPSNWKLKAQMVFGNINSPAGDKNHEPVEQRLKVFG